MFYLTPSTLGPWEWTGGSCSPRTRPSCSLGERRRKMAAQKRVLLLCGDYAEDYEVFPSPIACYSIGIRTIYRLFRCDSRGFLDWTPLSVNRSMDIYLFPVLIYMRIDRSWCRSKRCKHMESPLMQFVLERKPARYAAPLPNRVLVIR